MKLLWILLTSSTIIIAQVTVYPSNKKILVLGGNATFTCIYLTSNSESILGIQWLVNGSSFEGLNLTNAVSEFITIAGGIGKLHFFDLHLEYNNTCIRCMLAISSGHAFTSSKNILLLQGTLSAVGSLNLTVHLMDPIISLNWTAPFTLDITGVDPDISGYCVDVVNSTSLLTLHSECGISVTEFSYPIAVLNTSGCDDYLLVVTPVNAAGNGVKSNRTYSQALTPPRVVEGQKIVTMLSSTAQMDQILYSINLTAPVCSAEMTFVDQNTHERITLSHSDVSILWTNIIFTSEKLVVNRIYSVMVTASNIKGSATSNIEISTHDIVAVQSTSSHCIKTNYLLNSEAAGGLIMFMFISDNNDVNIDFSKSLFLPLSKNTSHNYTLPFPLLSGLYLIYAYDIERSGILSNGINYPAVADNHRVAGNFHGFIINPKSSNIEDCNVTTTQDVVSVLCTYHANSTSTGFLIIVQQNSNSKVRVLHVNHTRQGLAHEPVTVQVQENGVYHVTIFPVREESGIIGSSIGYSMQITLGDRPTQSTMLNDTPSHSVTSSDIPSPPGVTDSTVNLLLYLGVGIGSGSLSLIAFILSVVVIHHKMKLANLKESQNTVKEKTLDLPIEEMSNSVPNRVSPIYEEIGNPATSFTYTHNIFYGASTGLAVSEPLPEEQNQEHELPTSDTPTLGDAYQLRQCPAYGANNERQ